MSIKKERHDWRIQNFHIEGGAFRCYYFSVSMWGEMSMAIKPLKEQTIMNNYMFTMEMCEPKRINPLMEHILGKKIRKINVVEP